MKKFFKWLDSKLPDPPKRGVYIGDALLDCSIFTQLQIRVKRLEKAVDALKESESYRGSAHPPETPVRASVSD